MKGIVLIVMPDASQHVEVKIPNGIAPAQFDAIMNRIKHDFFTTVKPQADADSLVVTTYGIIKKTQKTPSKEIKMAEDIRIEYFNTKNKK